MTELDGLLASREMILVAGSGGVGKTTVAAALGIAAVQRHSARVLVVTVDPARRLASALGLEEFGKTRPTLVPLPWPAVAIRDEEIHGEIVAVDSFGNLITNVTRQHLSGLRNPAGLRVHCGGLKIPGLVKTYASQPAGSWVALFGSGGFLEIAIVQGNAHQGSDVGVGTPVVIGQPRG